MLRTDHILISEQQNEELVGILLRIYKVLPIGYVLLMLTTVLTNDWEVLVLIPLLGGFTFLAYRQAQAGRVQISVLTLLLVIILVVTLLSTYGQGIHDISLITFSCIVVLASFILKRPQQIIIGFSILLALSWLAFGEQYNLYTPEPIESGTYGDLVVILIILAISVIISFNLFKRLKWTLIRTNLEVNRSQETSQKLNNDLELTIELGSLVHDQVQSSLSTVRSLFSLENSESVSKIIRQIRCIERLHLFSSDTNVRVKDYFLEMDHSRVAHWSVNVSDDCLLPLDQMLSLVIYVDELLEINNPTVQLSISERDDSWKVYMAADKIIAPDSSLSDIMIRQLKAELGETSDGLTLTFAKTRYLS